MKFIHHPRTKKQFLLQNSWQPILLFGLDCLAVWSISNGMVNVNQIPIQGRRYFDLSTNISTYALLLTNPNLNQINRELSPLSFWTSQNYFQIIFTYTHPRILYFKLCIPFLLTEHKAANPLSVNFNAFVIRLTIICFSFVSSVLFSRILFGFSRI
jgi:hypothetical protein